MLCYVTYRAIFTSRNSCKKYSKDRLGHYFELSQRERLKIVSQYQENGMDINSKVQTTYSDALYLRPLGKTPQYQEDEVNLISTQNMNSATNIIKEVNEGAAANEKTCSVGGWGIGQSVQNFQLVKDTERMLYQALEELNSVQSV